MCLHPKDPYGITAVGVQADGLCGRGKQPFCVSSGFQAQEPQAAHLLGHRAGRGLRHPAGERTLWPSFMRTCTAEPVVAAEQSNVVVDSKWAGCCGTL